MQEVDLKGRCLQPDQLGFKYMNVFEAKTVAKKEKIWKVHQEKRAATMGAPCRKLT